MTETDSANQKLLSGGGSSIFQMGFNVKRAAALPTRGHLACII